MQKYDAQLLASSLNALCDVFDKKPIPERALAVWFETLKEFPTELVMDAVNAWARTHTKFPAPAEVWKAVNDRSIGQRERKAVEAKKQETFHPGVGGAQADRFLAQMRDVFKKPKWSPQQHWERLVASAPAGSIGHRYATEALKSFSHVRTREPGEDDELERAA